MSLPPISTEPVVGRSRPPSKCSSVLLPEPEAPTTASCCPARSFRSIDFNTSIGAPISVKVLPRPWHSIMTSLFIPERFRGLYLRRPPGRIQRGKYRQHKRNQTDHTDIGPVQIRRQVADVIDIGRKEFDMEYAFEESDDLLHIQCQQSAADHADEHSGQTDNHALNDKYLHHTSRRQPERTQDRDIALLVRHHHHQCRYDVENGHDQNQGQNNEHDELLGLDRLEEVGML